jgi:hypothetical protein
MKKLVLLIPFVLLVLSADSGGIITVPNDLRMPKRGEAPRYPQDIIIGELGRGEASQNAYSYAQNLLSALLRGDAKSAVLVNINASLLNSTLSNLKTINPQKVRLGGGREEDDGSTSFIFRFIGREQWIVGELYIRFGTMLPRVSEAPEDTDSEEAVRVERTPVAQWNIDDIILDDATTTGASRETYPYDFSPYERFF